MLSPTGGSASHASSPCPTCTLQDIPGPPGAQGEDLPKGTGQTVLRSTRGESGVRCSEAVEEEPVRALAAGTSTKEPLFPAAGTWPGPAARQGARVGAQVLGPGSAAPCWMLDAFLGGQQGAGLPGPQPCTTWARLSRCHS